jgi:hypothetical protein
VIPHVGVAPVLQVAVPPAGAGQAVHSAPQVAMAVFETQTPLQLWKPALQEIPQTGGVPAQVAVEPVAAGHGAHRLPHEAVLVLLTQAVPHRCVPAVGQVVPQTPAVQVAVPPVGAVQFAAVQQFAVGMQVVPQTLKPVLHVKPQVPPVQIEEPFAGAAHAVLQQTPDTQLPLAQGKPPVVHAVPFGSFWQVVLTQLLPPRASQSAVVVAQVVLQTCVVALHWKLPHSTGDEATQVPLPLQVGAGIADSDSDAAAPATVPVVAAAHEAAPHTVPAAVSWQPALPSHLPVLPQLLAAPVGHMVAMRGAVLAAMLLHVPMRAAMVQLWQPLVQALLQQTPSVQNPLVQSVLTAHA